MLLFPGDPGFYETLHALPPPGERVSSFFIVESNSRLMRNVTADQFREYLLGGEYQEVIGSEEYFNDNSLEEFNGDEEVLI